MAKAAKLSILILFLLLVLSVGFAGYTIKQKFDIEKQKIALEKEVVKLKKENNRYVADIKKKDADFTQANVAKEKLEGDLASLSAQLEAQKVELTQKMEGISRERDDWKSRIDTIRKERDDLLAKLQQVSEPQIVYKEVVKEVPAQKEAPVQKEDHQLSAGTQEAEDAAVSQNIAEMLTIDNENYWAAVLKKKAALEVEIESLRNDLSAKIVEVSEYKKKNSDLEIEIERLTDEKESIVRQIKHGKDVADTLSLDLARAQNENKFKKDRIDKISNDNEELRQKVKQLTSTKISLEKSIVRITDEKTGVERKLMETESVIQNRIDEIWGIKDSIEQHFQDSPIAAYTSEIEIPPIVVSADAPAGKTVKATADDITQEASAGFKGNVVSVNKENNFIIVDIGESVGVQIGDELSVYRGAKYIAGLEVIQSRKDICAADIKQKVADIRIGDVVR